MAEFVITAPDGKKYKVTGATKEGALSALKKRLGGGDLPKGQRFKQGLVDIGQGVMQLGAHAGPSITPPPPPGMDAWPADINPAIPQGLAPGADQAIAQQQAGYAQDRAAAGGEGMDWMRLGGNITAMLPMSLATPAPTTLGGALTGGAIGGAASSALAPVAMPGANFWLEKAKQAGTGLATGAAAGGLVNMASKFVAPKVSEAVTALQKRGVTPTPGQILGQGAAKMEDRLTGIPILGNAVASSQKRALDQFNAAVLDDVLSPIGAKAPGKIGYEGVDAVHGIIGKAYDDLLPQLTFKADDALVGELDNIAKMAAEMPEEQARRFNEIVTKKVISRLSQTDMMDGKTFKGVESELSRIAKGLLRDSSFDNRELGAAVNEVLTSLRSNLERANPQHQGMLGKLNESFSKLVKLENAAARIGTDDGIFTPAQFMAAVRASDSSIRKNKFARGEAAMQGLAREGKQVLGAKYPDSGTVGRSIPAAAALGGAGWADLGMTAGALGAGSLAYTPLAQRILAWAMTQRPQAAEPIAELIRRSTVPAATAGAAGYGLLNK